MRADLHCHSYYSDGSESIESIIKQARYADLDYIAITDHDTMGGVHEAKALGNRYNIPVIAGVECSSLDTQRSRSVHVLCYNPKDILTLQRFIDHTVESRNRQRTQMIEKVRELYPVELSEVLEKKGRSPSIFECHIMQVIASKGYTNSVCGMMMKELLSPKGRCYVKSDYADVRETVRVARDCGAVVVIAHPQEYDSFDLIDELSDKRLIDGVEVFHPRNNDASRKRLLDVAEKHNLIVTGGSDFHGCYSFTPHPIGYCTTDAANLNRILNFKRT